MGDKILLYIISINIIYHNLILPSPKYHNIQRHYLFIKMYFSIWTKKATEYVAEHTNMNEKELTSSWVNSVVFPGNEVVATPLSHCK